MPKRSPVLPEYAPSPAGPFQVYFRLYMEDFVIDTDTWFIFCVLFISALALPVLIYVAFPYRIRKRERSRIRSRKEQQHATYDRIEQKYEQRKLQELEKDVQTLQTDLSNDLHELLQSTPTDAELIAFFSNFEKIYPEFGNSLRKLVPEISAHELKLCALLRLNLSSKEIGRLLNITQDSVNKARYRLRKKVGLDKKEDLYIFLSNI